MNPDKFEEKLASQQLRRIPEDWRSEILSRAGSEAPRNESYERGRWLRARMLEVFWPHPAAWATLVALSVMALALGSMELEPIGGVQRAEVVSPLEKRLVREQRTMLLQELGMVTLHPALEAAEAPEATRSEYGPDRFGIVPTTRAGIQKELA